MQVTVTQFSGGKTNYVDSEAINGISKYLYALCGKYGRSAEDILKPKISLVKDPSNYNFGNVYYNTFSPTKIFRIVCSNLNGGAFLTFSSLQSDFQISRDGISWGSSHDVSIDSGVFFSTVYVRFSPQTYGLIKGDLIINNGSLNKIIYLSGTGI
jgi:hypothetical protein